MSSHDTTTQANATDDRAVLLGRIADAASDLCDPSVHTEARHGWTATRNRKPLPPHRVTLPGLIQQLRDTIHPATSGNNTAGGHASSRPPLNLDALSRLASVEIAAIRWCWQQRLDLRSTVEANISALVGHAPQMTGDDQAMLLLDLRRWRTWANTATGWVTPPITPQAPCPACGAWSTLRVRVESDEDKLTVRSAYCTGTQQQPCDAVWADEGMEALAAHIAAYARMSRSRANDARHRAAEQAEREKALRRPAA